ncbi:hypothetical protein HNY73_005021 [Argiope bruennichi]|uniref:Uncharacterized protein n=1 Tax=Argiope bruennichi TaxID=94029 RepID=A0A8T0FHS0_ARGBR|nr:hypothetical protein HNY73_005021 [Argiope bruennichi]
MWERQRHLVMATQGKSDLDLLDLLMEFVKNEVDSEFGVKIASETFNTGKLASKNSYVNRYSDCKPVLSTACELLTANDMSLENSRIMGSAHLQIAKELEEETTKYFNETFCVNTEGRYEVALLLVLDNFVLSGNRQLAEKYLLRTKKKLIASGKLKVHGEVFDIWLTLGIIEKVQQGGIVRVHYLPHEPVIKGSSTTSIRPVFNASSHALGCPSFNDCLSTGPNLIEMIPNILNRFRRNYVGVMQT